MCHVVVDYGISMMMLTTLTVSLYTGRDNEGYSWFVEIPVEYIYLEFVANFLKEILTECFFVNLNLFFHYVMDVLCNSWWFNVGILIGVIVWIVIDDNLVFILGMSITGETYSIVLTPRTSRCMTDNWKVMEMTIQ